MSLVEYFFFVPAHPHLDEDMMATDHVPRTDEDPSRWVPSVPSHTSEELPSRRRPHPVDVPLVLNVLGDCEESYSIIPD